jgi:hypothetical protein
VGKPGIAAGGNSGGRSIPLVPLCAAFLEKSMGPDEDFRHPSHTSWQEPSPFLTTLMAGNEGYHADYQESAPI